MAITVFIADDQAMVRQGFGALLTAQHDISVIGDADKVGYIEGAVRSGHLVGRTI